MKKLILLLAFFLVAGYAFADEPRDIEFFALEVTIGVPVHWTNSPVPHEFAGGQYDRDRTVTANTALGLAFVFNFNRTFGLMLETDFFFGQDLLGNSSNFSNSNSLFGANVFLGPVFYLYNGPNLRIPWAIGAHLYYWSSSSWFSGTSIAGGNDAWVSTTDLQIGPATSLGMQFHFDRNIYILSRTLVALHVYRSHETIVGNHLGVQSESCRDFGIAWHIKPTLGVGIKF
ncbi:MAG: hypothetical protein FWC36_08275 [Spirochaetes bacterium]|nr:hypothetical protein [Spirochaetota bacterium]